MIPTQTLVEYPVFGNAACLVKPGDAKYAGGFLPADVLPAEWHNWFLNTASSAITCLNAGVGSMEAELNCVVTSAGLQPAEGTPGQVAQAISCCVTNAVTRTIQITDNAGTNCGNAVSFTSATALQIALPAIICATLQGNAATATLATCAQKDGSGCSFGTAARFSCDTFMAKAGGTFTGVTQYNADLKICCAICFNDGVQDWCCTKRAIRMPYVIGIDCYICGGRVYYSSIDNVCVGYANYANDAARSTDACCAKCNSSGVAFGSAAVRNYSDSSGQVSSTQWANTDPQRHCLISQNWLAYWDGSYKATIAGSSNLKYTANGSVMDFAKKSAENTFTNTIKFCGLVKLDSCVTDWKNNKPAGQPTNMPYFLGIEPYVCGGRVYYTTAADACVGLANCASTAGQAAYANGLSYYNMYAKGTSVGQQVAKCCCENGRMYVCSCVTGWAYRVGGSPVFFSSGVTDLGCNTAYNCNWYYSLAH